jgi:hypothetical protein
MVMAPFRIPDLYEPDTDRADEELDELCVPTAQVAECTCPDFCERDHDND